MASAPRITVLSAELADQIAAGEVVERPASIVKELVENAIDAGARKVDVMLEGGGVERISVVDDGAGMHPEDLVLAVRRHATSKVKTVDDLVEIASLGFRGEALASIAAVARLRLRSRLADRDLGAELSSVAGAEAPVVPVGMPIGTHVEIRGLFAGLPARRKFLRSEAAEVARCTEALLRIGLVHPEVHLRMRHGERQLLELSPASLDQRVVQVLERRAPGPFHEFSGEYEGVAVRGWLDAPERATRTRHGITVVVRRRVVHDRSVAQVLVQAVSAYWGSDVHPVACLMIDPPPGSVDVNVHPQKSEVRFRAPQSVYAAVRRVVADGLATAPWRQSSSTAGSEDGPYVEVAGPRATAAADERHPQVPYRLHTRATRADYDHHKRQWRDAVDRLSAPLPASPDLGSLPGSSAALGSSVQSGDEPSVGPQLLTCLPGPIGLFRDGDDLLAVDLRRLRAHLLHSRLSRDLGGGALAAQGLLNPVVVGRPAQDVEALRQARDRLARLGLDIEAFGADAVLVRAVPAHLKDCVVEADMAELIDRILPWIRLADPAGALAAEDGAVRAMAGVGSGDPAPRLARRWIRELVEQGVALDQIPGIRRLTPAELLARPSESS